MSSYTDYKDKGGTEDNSPEAMEANDEDTGFDSLDKQSQNELLKYVMQGKPSTPQNMNAARSMLLNDPETVQSLCEKLGIDDGHAGDDEKEQDDGE